jgi:hypothetical protein
MSPSVGTATAGRQAAGASTDATARDSCASVRTWGHRVLRQLAVLLTREPSALDHSPINAKVPL